MTPNAKLHLDPKFFLAEIGAKTIAQYSKNQVIFRQSDRADAIFYIQEGKVKLTGDALVPEQFRGAHKAHRTQYLNQPLTRPMGSGLKLEARRKDGSHFPVSLSPVKSDKGVRVTGIIRDITKRRQMQNELRTVQEKYIHELELRNRESEKANQLKTEFLSKSPPRTCQSANK